MAVSCRVTSIFSSLDDLDLLHYTRRERCPLLPLEDRRAAQDDCFIINSSRARPHFFAGKKSVPESGDGCMYCQCRKRNMQEQQQQEPFFDPLASPGPRSLLRLVPSEIDLSVGSPSTSFKAPATVPFRWEEAPGKPKTEHLISCNSSRTLTLPPRLLRKSFAGDGVTRKHPAKSVSHAFHSSSTHGAKKEKHSSQLFFKSADLKEKQSSQLLFKSADLSTPRWKSFFSGGLDPPSASPRSVLVNPRICSGSSSSSSQPSCSFDSDTITPPGPVLEIWTDLTAIAGQGTTSPEGEGDVCFGFSEEHSWPDRIDSPLKELAPPPEQQSVSGSSDHQWVQAGKSLSRIFKLIKARSVGKRNASAEVHMWAPTLAAYFHSTSKSEQLDRAKCFDGGMKLSGSRAVGNGKRMNEVATPPLNHVCHCKSWDRALQTPHLRESFSAPLKPTQVEYCPSKIADKVLSSEFSEKNFYKSPSCSPAVGSWLAAPQIRLLHSGRQQKKSKTRTELVDIQRRPATFESMVKAMKNFFHKK